MKTANQKWKKKKLEGRERQIKDKWGKEIEEEKGQGKLWEVKGESRLKN